MNGRFLTIMSLLLAGGAIAYVAYDKFYLPQQNPPVSHIPGGHYMGGTVGDPYASCDLMAIKKAGSFVVAARRGRVEEVEKACIDAGFKTSVIWKVELVECRWTGELTQEKLEKISHDPNVEFVEANSIRPRVQEKRLRTNQPVPGSTKEEGASSQTGENDAQHNSNTYEEGVDQTTFFPTDQRPLRNHYGIGSLRRIQRYV